jgi:hypothetical protein
MDIKLMATSDNGNKDSGKGRDKGGRDDNNLRSSKDTGRKMGNNMGNNTSSYRIGGSNMVQDKVPSLPVHNTIPQPDYDGIGWSLLYPE